LTASEQTQYENVSVDGYLKQARIVFEHYKTQEPAKEVAFSWMARGEALANPILLRDGKQIAHLADVNNLIPKFNISTIMPATLKTKLAWAFSPYAPTIYYSLYSMSHEFRKKWMPGAMEPNKALDLLAEYQTTTNKIIRLHWAFIEGENDSLDDLEAIANAIQTRGLVCDFNLVRYNPYSSLQGKEPSEGILHKNVEYLQTKIRGKAKIVKRVGFDVKASCGMFVEGQG
jgi:adenine C2-methylase RlmN of 23S rRNA A2503 and tRNA A37